jgi:hypothetical protein
MEFTIFNLFLQVNTSKRSLDGGYSEVMPIGRGGNWRSGLGLAYLFCPLRLTVPHEPNHATFPTPPRQTGSGPGPADSSAFKPTRATHSLSEISGPLGAKSRAHSVPAAASWEATAPRLSQMI